MSPSKPKPITDLPMKRLLLIGMLCLFGTFAHAQITQIEYFIDTEPGYGKGISVPLTADTDGYINFNIPLQSVDEGFHNLFIRTKRNDGKWSHTDRRVFFVRKGHVSPRITKILYSFSGEGASDKVYEHEVVEPLPMIDISFFANLAELPHSKTYKIYLQALEENGFLSKKDSAEFFVRAPILINLVNVTNVTCFESNDGGVEISASIEEGELEYSLDNAAFISQNSFSNLTSGDYTVYVRDKANPSNVVQESFTVSAPDDISIVISEITSPTCPGTQTGSFKVSATGGTGVFTYKLDSDSEFQNSDVFNELAAGDYTVEVRDENGCIKSTPLTIQPPVEIAISISSAIGPVCPSDATGSITVSATGGSGGHTYKLSSQNEFQAGSTFGDLEAGTYTVTVRDSNGCVKSIDIPLNPTGDVPPVPSISIEGKDGISEEVSLLSSSTSNNQWFRNGTEITGATGQSLEITQPGSYQVRVTSATGCTSLSQVTVITSSPEIKDLKLKIYPNPAESFTKIDFGREILIDRVMIYSSSGIVLRDIKEQVMVDELQLDISGLSPGSYIIQIKGIGLFERIKLIKQ